MWHLSRCNTSNYHKSKPLPYRTATGRLELWCIQFQSILLRDVDKLRLQPISTRRKCYLSQCISKDSDYIQHRPCNWSRCQQQFASDLHTQNLSGDWRRNWVVWLRVDRIHHHNRRSLQDFNHCHWPSILYSFWCAIVYYWYRRVNYHGWLEQNFKWSHTRRNLPWLCILTHKYWWK